MERRSGGPGEAGAGVGQGDAQSRSRELGALHLHPVKADDLLLYRLPRCS
jgi:hypothetical protein